MKIKLIGKEMKLWYKKGVKQYTHPQTQFAGGIKNKVKKKTIIIQIYLHFHCECLSEPLLVRCGSNLHEQIDLSHIHICAI